MADIKSGVASTTVNPLSIDTLFNLHNEIGISANRTLPTFPPKRELNAPTLEEVEALIDKDVKEKAELAEKRLAEQKLADERRAARIGGIQRIGLGGIRRPLNLGSLRGTTPGGLGVTEVKSEVKGGESKYPISGQPIVRRLPLSLLRRPVELNPEVIHQIDFSNIEQYTLPQLRTFTQQLGLNVPISIDKTDYIIALLSYATEQGILK